MWAWFRHEFQLLCIALQFLTRVPIPAWVGFEASWLTTCVRHFPLVGALVGLWGAGVLWLAAQLFHPALAAVLAVGATVWLTGAFHEDGLADTCDALMGWVPREKALTIMKDSRIGTYGAVGLVFMSLLRVGLVASLVQIDLGMACFSLLISHVWARTCSVVLMVMLPYGGDADHAKAKPLALDVPAALVLPALAWSAFAVLAPLPGMRLAVAAALLLLWVVWMRQWLLHRLGGFTGDALGATEQGAEVLFLMAMAASVPPALGVVWGV